MRYSEWTPPPPLSRFVEAIWRLSGTGDPDAFELVLPDGRPELVLHRAARCVHIDRHGRTVRQAPAMLVGQIRRGLPLAPEGEVATIGVRFRPHGLRLLSGEPADRLVDRHVEVGALGLAWLTALTDHALAADSADAAATLLADGLAGRAAGTEPPPPVVAQAVAAIAGGSGRLPVARMAARFDRSPRQLERLFLEHVGLSPKRLSRIVRFQSALALLTSARPEATGTEVAHAAGYFDQAHFIRDVREFAGEPPTSLLRDGLADLTAAFARPGTD